MIRVLNSIAVALPFIAVTLLIAVIWSPHNGIKLLSTAAVLIVAALFAAAGAQAIDQTRNK